MEDAVAQRLEASALSASRVRTLLHGSGCIVKDLSSANPVRARQSGKIQSFLDASGALGVRKPDRCPTLSRDSSLNAYLDRPEAEADVRNARSGAYGAGAPRRPIKPEQRQ